jgi:predicted HAD superfamily Cof-like phosphohydrolase
MNLEQHSVQQFHETFDITVGQVPHMPSEKDAALRVKLIQEELNELAEALTQHDVVEIADAIGDILYVTYGAAVTCGMDMKPLFAEIHRSNMTKIGGHKNEDGKWVKPSTYERPKLLPILEAQGYKVPE